MVGFSNMNNVTSERKQSVLKTLAIIGLVGIILIVAWLSVQIVKVFPTAVNSLASLADSVYSYDPRAPKPVELESTVEKVESGESFTINWVQPLKTGNYAITYECKDGLAVDMKTADTEFKGIECGDSYDLGAVNSAELMVVSEKNLETEVNYTITYFRANMADYTSTASNSVVVTNQRFAVAKPEEEVVVPTTPEVTEPKPEVTEPEATKPEVTPVPAPKPKPTAPVVQTPVVTYAIPVSNPNGFTDLEITYLGIGLVDQNGIFNKTGLLAKNAPAAMQFAVKNIGTKTSGNWTFESELPNNGNFKSVVQTGLKPNERATMTIAFTAPNSTSLQNFSVAVNSTSDTNLKNNNFNWTVVVVQ
jgi:outer membrane biosynthesis protein TonB